MVITIPMGHAFTLGKATFVMSDTRKDGAIIEASAHPRTYHT